MFWNIQWKKNRFIGLLALYFVYFAYVPICFSVNVEILVDGSDSMRGFFKMDSIQSLVKSLTQSTSEKKVFLKRAVFISRRAVSGEIQTEKQDYHIFAENFDRGQANFGTHTLLDVAFDQRNPQADILFIVTDNIQSDPDSQESTERFYRKFRQTVCKRIYILPKLLYFDGEVFYNLDQFSSLDEFRSSLISVNGDGVFESDGFIKGQTEYRAMYHGKRGLIVYVIQLNNNATTEDVYRQILLAMEGEKQVLLIKPIDDKKIGIDGSVEPLDAKIKKNRPPNMRLEGRNNGNSLVPFDMVNSPLFQSDRCNFIRFYFRLYSKLKHVNIGKPSDSGKIDVPLSVSNPVVSVLPADENLIKIDRSNGIVRPPYFVETLYSIDEQGRQGTAQYYYVVEILFGPYKIQWKNFFTLIWRNKIPVRMTFNIEMKVPRNQLFLSKSFQDRYFTDNPSRIDRIYTPADLIEYLSEKMIQIDIPVEVGR